MSLLNLLKRRKPSNRKPSKIAEVHFTQGHRLTLGFVVDLLGTLREKQHNYDIDDILALHIGHLAEIYTHVVDHLKQSGNR